VADMSEARSEDAAGSAQPPRLAPRLVRLWSGVLLAPLSWVADFIIRYAVVRFANAHDHRWPFAVSTAGALAVLAVGVTLCWRTRRGGQAAAEENTLAAWGLGLALFFFILILCEAFPTLVLSPGELA